MFEKIIKFFRMGLYNKEQVLKFFEKGVITKEEYESIIAVETEETETEAVI